jgi:hypothetical protein
VDEAVLLQQLHERLADWQRRASVFLAETLPLAAAASGDAVDAAHRAAGDLLCAEAGLLEVNLGVLGGAQPGHGGEGKEGS